MPLSNNVIPEHFNTNGGFLTLAVSAAVVSGPYFSDGLSTQAIDSCALEHFYLRARGFCKNTT